MPQGPAEGWRGVGTGLIGLMTGRHRRLRKVHMRMSNIRRKAIVPAPSYSADVVIGPCPTSARSP